LDCIVKRRGAARSAPIAPVQAVQRLWKRSSIRSGNFVQLLSMSTYDEGGLSYRLPDHFRHDESSEW